MGVFMRGPSLLILAALLTATPALAQDPLPAENTRAACTDGRDNDGDGHIDCADQDCQDFTFCAASRAMTTSGPAVDDVSRMRGRGTTRLVLGAVLLSLGVVVGGVSAVPWVAGDGHSFTNSPAQEGALAMDVVGVAMIGAGTALLAIGAGNLAETRRPKFAIGPASLAVRF
jgi:hypothetical protein